MPSLADLQQAFYAQYGYAGSLADMEYQYLSNPPTLDSYGFVRVASPYATTAGTLNANYTYYHRVIEGGTFTILRININVSSGNICIAAYKNTGSGVSAKPGNRIATTGSIPCPPNAASVDIPMGSSVTVAAGDWLAVGADNAVASFISTNGAGGGVAGLANFMVEVIYPAPAVATANVSNTRMINMIGVP
jgi:hypothetical protein